MNKVTFAFIVKDRLVKKSVWDVALFNAPNLNERANVLVHASDDNVSDALRPYLIERQENSWDKLIHVWFGLFRAFLEDGDAQKLAILSGSCVPLRGFDTICDTLLSKEGSVLTRHALLDSHKRKVGNRRFSFVLSNDYKVAESWVVLDRAFVETLCKHEKDVKSWFVSYRNDAEAVAATLLNYFKLPYTFEPLWWIEWTHGAKHPNILNLTMENIDKATEDGALFARKVDDATDTAELTAAIADEGVNDTELAEALKASALALEEAKAELVVNVEPEPEVVTEPTQATKRRGPKTKAEKEAAKSAAPIKATGNRVLVMAAVGKNSKHKEWLGDKANAKFDLLLIDYSGERNDYREDATYYDKSKGVKFNLFWNYLIAHKEIIPKYDYFWVMDDDLVTNTADMNRFIDFVVEKDLVLAQPALTKGSTNHWENFRVDTECTHRNSAFVEIMAPIMRADFFNLQFASWNLTDMGLFMDVLYWPYLLDKHSWKHKCAIVDLVEIGHYNPVGAGPLYKLKGIRKSTQDRMTFSRLSEKKDLLRIGASRRVPVYKRHLKNEANPA